MYTFLLQFVNRIFIKKDWYVKFNDIDKNLYGNYSPLNKKRGEKIFKPYDR